MINKVILVGNLGSDPEIRTTNSGTKVAKLNIATTERIYNKETQESKERTEWHNVIMWRHMAEIAEKYLTKGSQTYIEGKLQTRSWEDAGGVKRYTTEIIAETIKLLGRKAENYTQSNIESQSQKTTEDIDDLPF